MRIALDVSQIIYKGSGVGRFTEGLVKTICEYDSTNDWIFFFSSFRGKLDETIKNKIASSRHTLIETKLPPTLLSFLWNNLHFFSIDSLIGKVDWLITSDWTEPPSKNRKATIVHDLVYLKYPDTVDALIRKTQDRRLRWVQKESLVVFADSDSTKHDLITDLAINKKKIFVNYPGVSQPAVYVTKKSTKRPYILTVGKREPRKNLERLVKAFHLLERNDLDLVIVGMDGWGNVSIESNPQVQLRGYVSDDELADLYRNCLCFVFPSLYEGFGYPVIEAMSYGAPVVTSSSSSLQEIAGDAAVLFDPLQEESIAAGIKKVINSTSLRSSLSKKGIAKSKEFSWKKYLDNLLQVLDSTSSPQVSSEL